MDRGRTSVYRLMQKSRLGRINARVRTALIRLAGYLDAVDSAARNHLDPDTRPREGGVARSGMAIVIVTYQDRQEEYCQRLVEQLRSGGVEAPIVVVVNGLLGRRYDSQLRQKFLLSMARFSDVSVTMSRTMMPLARAWNIGIQMADEPVCVVLNDDLWIRGSGVAEDLRNLVGCALDEGLAIGNNSFSHFAISYECLLNVGFFDERYLGVGEEDGDYIWRFIESTGHAPARVPLRAFVNVEDPSHGDYVTGRGKYTLACSVYSRMKFQPHTDGIQGSFDQPRKRFVDEVEAHPLWAMHRDMQVILSLPTEEDIRGAICHHLDASVGIPVNRNRDVR